MQVARKCLQNPGRFTAAYRQKFKAMARDGTPFQMELRYVHPDGSLAWVSADVSPIREEVNQSAVAAALVVVDYTEREEAARHRELLLRELNHRVKNTLATVQAIAQQTLKHAPDLEHFRETFTSRLLALFNTHELLARESWRGAGLRAMVEAELAPYSAEGRPPAIISGEEITLPPKMALALNLALHELATNAGKYGALSAHCGQIAVSWDLVPKGDKDWLCVRWAEHGGPAVSPPSRRGFGTRLITLGIAHELGAKVALDFPVTGVTCTMEVPMPEAASPGSPDDELRPDGRG